MAQDPLQKATEDLEKAANAFLDKLEAILFDTHFALAKKELQELVNLAAKVGALQQVQVFLPAKEETEETEDKD
jgi:hypothetical protein